MKKLRVFLGGTCNESTWRNQLISKLTIDFFNPIVDDWTEADQKREIEERETCDYCLYVITPKITGVYSIAELTDDSCKRPDKTIFCFITRDGEWGFNKGQIKSLEQVGKLIESNGAKWLKSLEEVAVYLNNQNN